MASPRTYAELFQFYHELVKPLYSEIQLTNSLPVEVLFEINASFDHLSRAWTYGDAEPVVVEKAYSHLKRSALDIFKIIVKNSIVQFEELTKIDISIIDNGAFETELRKLHHEIKELAWKARKGEGDVRRDDKAAVAAFELWEPVYERCKRLEKEFYRNEKWVWAKQKHKRGALKNLAVGFLMGVLTGVVASFIYDAVKPNKGTQNAITSATVGVRSVPAPHADPVVAVSSIQSSARTAGSR